MDLHNVLKLEESARHVVEALQPGVERAGNGNVADKHAEVSLLTKSYKVRLR